MPERAFFIASKIKRLRMKENFMKGNYGLFVHYLVKNNDASVTSEQWNAQTESFDAEGLARQAHEVGAKWLFFTMGQASGHYAAPNAAFDEISGETPSKTAIFSHFCIYKGSIL